MGRTILSATQTWVEEEKSLARFLRALRKNDQELLEELIALSHTHIAEASYASNLYPLDIYLVSMLLELYKKVRQLERKLEENGLLPVTEFNAPSRGITSLLDLVDQVSQPSLQSVPDPEPPAGEEAPPAEYVDLQEGA